MLASVTGGSWIAANGWGRLREGGAPTFCDGAPRIPAPASVFTRPLARWGRFDNYTKLGCSSVALALCDAGLDEGGEERRIGIVTSSVWESLTVDLAYFETAAPQGGELASPNLFSYTLPGTMHGECAGHFGLTGPTVCVGEDGGRGQAALTTALRLMAAGAAQVMVAGWLDDPPVRPGEHRPEAGAVSGAAFVVLELDPRDSPGAHRHLHYECGRVRLDAGGEVTNLLDLFGN